MNPLYRNNTYLMEAETVIGAVLEAENGETALILRDLAFFPGGGGQPKETTGSLILREQEFAIQDLVKHQGDVKIVLKERIGFHSELKRGEPAFQKVDASRRLRAARLHTLQHTYGAAVRIAASGYATKGMEIADDLSECTMRFTVTQALQPDQIQQLETLVADAILNNLSIETRTYESIEAVRAEFGEAFRIDPSLPPYKGNRLRTIVIGAESPLLQDASLCGGTHLQGLAEVGGFRTLSYKIDSASTEHHITFSLSSE